jgi:hypothetical protein
MDTVADAPCLDDEGGFAYIGDYSADGVNHWLCYQFRTLKCAPPGS